MSNVHNMTKVKWEAAKAAAHWSAMSTEDRTHSVSRAGGTLSYRATLPAPITALPRVTRCIKGLLLIHQQLPMHRKSLKGQDKPVWLSGRREEGCASGKARLCFLPSFLWDMWVFSQCTKRKNTALRDDALQKTVTDTKTRRSEDTSLLLMREETAESFPLAPQQGTEETPVTSSWPEVWVQPDEGLIQAIQPTAFVFKAFKWEGWVRWYLKIASSLKFYNFP